MGRKRKIAQTVVDPTLPNVPLTIDGKEYFLNFDLGALAEAKRHFARQGHKVNLLIALSELDVDNLMVLFPCSLHKNHPEITFEEAQKMISFPVLFAISGAVYAAWERSMPANKGGKENSPNPPQP